jgi:nucleotide-binding universal stress UspA family protein
VSVPRRRNGRIVVAFDPNRPDAAALEFAVPFARALAQAVYALYVEDVDTLSLGAFGCVSTVCAATGETRLMSRESIERDFRRLERQARAAFDSAARAAGRAEFATVRGRLAEELRRVSDEAAAVLIGRPEIGLARSGLAAGVLDTLLALPVAVTGLIAARRAPGSGVLAVLRPERFAAAGGAAALLGAPLPKAALRALGTELPPLSISGRGLEIGALLRELRRANIGTLLLELGATADDRVLVRELLNVWPGSLLAMRGEET